MARGASKGSAAAPLEKKADPARPSRREWQRDLTRQRILDTAYKIFSMHDYAQVVVDDLAKQAGVSRATFYLYFNSKEALVAALMPVAFRRVIQHYEALAALPPTQKAVENWLTELIHYLRDNRVISRVVMQAAELQTSLNENVHEALEAILDVLVRIKPARAGSARGRPAVIRERWRLLLLQLERVSHLIAVYGWQLNERILVKEMARQWTSMLNHGDIV